MSKGAIGGRGLAVLLALGLAVEAPAAASSPVSLGGDEESEQLRRQLRAELRALGLEVVELPPNESVSLAREVERGIIIDAAKNEARIVVRSTYDGTLRERVVAIARLQSDGDVRIVALQLVEVLQTLVSEGDRGPDPASTPQPSAAETAVSTTPTTPTTPTTLGLWLAPGAQWSPGGLGAGGHVDLGLAWMVRPWLGPALVTSWPVLARRAESEEGRIRAWPLAVSTGVRVRTGAANGRVRFELLATVGGAVLLLRGDARSPYEGRRAQATVLDVQARPGMSLALARRVRLRVDGLVGGQWPRVATAVAGREAAALDPLVVGGSLGLELELEPRMRRAR